MDKNAEIKQAIDTFNIEQARILLREQLLANPNAETYYLASQVAINDEQKKEFLQKAVELDPMHTNAVNALSKLGSLTTSREESQDKRINPNISTDDFERSLARQKSFIGPAVITFVLTLFFWLPGLIANILYIREAKKAQQKAGEKLAGTGCLWFLLILNGIIPAVAVIILIIAGVASSRPVSVTVINQTDCAYSISLNAIMDRIEPSQTKQFAVPVPAPPAGAISISGIRDGSITCTGRSEFGTYWLGFDAGSTKEILITENGVS